MPILGACENVRSSLHRVFRGERHVRRPGLPRMDFDRDNKVDGCSVRSADCKWRLNHLRTLGLQSSVRGHRQNPSKLPTSLVQFTVNLGYHLLSPLWWNGP